MKQGKNRKSSYKDAGVSIERGNQLVERIKKHAAATHGPGVMGNLGGFGAMFDLPALEFRDPILVSGTDGVGTKVKLAVDLQVHYSIGIDLVAMCVNDLVVQGARPLFFLDYFATSRLDVDIASDVIAGIAEGCQIAGCALVGGETAEMPGMYGNGDYDLAGFCVGAVERDQVIDGSKVTDGDALIALASSGPHANGYSLIRKILREGNIDTDSEMDGRTIGEVLLEPTRIYVKSILALHQALQVKAVAHITGGGLTENLPRVLPDGLGADLDTASWCIPPVFAWLQQTGNVETNEMFRTFNCGVGMIICVAEEDLPAALSHLTKAGETAWKIGHVNTTVDSDHRVKYSGAG